jgi:outer membrane protein assembly factor BamB
MRSARRVVLTGCLVLGIAAGGQAAAAVGPSCAGPAGGGEWPLYGHDLGNSRTQPDENTIDTARAGALQKAFAITSVSVGGTGPFHGTPIVAGGCLYAATSDGVVFAANADTGEIVWKVRYEVGVSGTGGTVTGSVTVDGDTAFIEVSDAGHPFIAALDRLTGAERWRNVVVDDPTTFINSSPVPFNGMVFTGFSGDELIDGDRGGYAILDQRDGHILARHYVIPDADYAAGYWGGGVWSTAAYDAGSRYLFVGTGNPASHNKESRFTNALLKIDADPARPTFGAIVDAYKGTPDQYYPGLDQQPACQAEPDIEYLEGWSATCVQLDIDFGASPNLWTTPSGELMLGDLQKAGVYHAVHADVMEQAWTSVVGTPCFGCNQSSPAFSGTAVYTAADAPGQLVSLVAANGAKRWVHPLADLLDAQPVSVANGLVYHTDLYGYLRILDAGTGLPVAVKDLGSDAGSPGSASGLDSSGVAIARHTVYAADVFVLVAYR